ncbi:endonuclease/exonuclease/phosphatase family protein [Streptomyces sp. NPDC049627]|uniref:endonuclease/exonuclease/phosphatase family protein n=1 Tax=Streptomyces sp. NPDC049627 TaxID=3365595 RepID=UPI00378E5B74
MTWNLRAFGDLTRAWKTGERISPKRNFADVHAIAAVIRRFDVVAVQEVRGNLRALRHMLRILGDDWAFILTDVPLGKAGNNERLAFLFDTRRVKPSGLACEPVVPIEQDAGVSTSALDRQFARTAHAVSFLSAGQTFTLVTLHVNYGKWPLNVCRSCGLLPSGRSAGWTVRQFDWDHNLIALGDFNIDRVGDPLFEAFTSTGLTPALQMEGLPRAIFDKPGAEHFYDKIAWFTKDRSSVQRCFRRSHRDELGRWSSSGAPALTANRSSLMERCDQWFCCRPQSVGVGTAQASAIARVSQ